MRLSGAYIGHIDEALQLFFAPLLTEYQRGKYPSSSKHGQVLLQGPKRSDRAYTPPCLLAPGPHRHDYNTVFLRTR